VTADEHAVFLGDAGGKVDQWLARDGVAGEHENLRTVVLHVVLHYGQLESRLKRGLVRVCLTTGAPIDVCKHQSKTGFSSNSIIDKGIKGKRYKVEMSRG